MGKLSLIRMDASLRTFAREDWRTVWRAVLATPIRECSRTGQQSAWHTAALANRGLLQSGGGSVGQQERRVGRWRLSHQDIELALDYKGLRADARRVAGARVAPPVEAALQQQRRQRPRVSCQPRHPLLWQGGDCLHSDLTLGFRTLAAACGKRTTMLFASAHGR